MKKIMKRDLSLLPFWITLMISVVWLLFVYDKGLNRLFMTANQSGYRYYENKNYINAAKDFENLSFKGASYFRAAEFKNAKSLYQNLSSKEDTYNLGNTFVMLGDYENAIKTYERALEIDPSFKEAHENLIVAKARKILKEPENDGQQGAGLLGADDIVYDNSEGKGVDDDSSAQNDTAQGNPNWLDRLQTGPKDFLKNKFRYQYEILDRSNAN
jgi:Ca-activated chloride channel family protein